MSWSRGDYERISTGAMTTLPKSLVRKTETHARIHRFPIPCSTIHVRVLRTGEASQKGIRILRVPWLLEIVNEIVFPHLHATTRRESQKCDLPICRTRRKKTVVTSVGFRQENNELCPFNGLSGKDIHIYVCI